MKAVAAALSAHPDMNVGWTESGMLVHEDVDISVAVATEGGLLTPVLRGAQNLALGTISRRLRDLAGRAREGRLRPEEYQGGGFTISNLGMYGLREFVAIINPPQSAILAVGAAQRRAVVDGDSCVPATVATLTLSVDHRAIDGAVAAAFLKALQNIIEHPLLMLS